MLQEIPVHKRIGIFILIVFFSFTVSGCAQKKLNEISGPKQPATKKKLDIELDKMLDRLLVRQQHHITELFPVAVVPHSVKQTSSFSRLEEIVMTRLASRLNENHEIVSLSGKNFLEYRENRPLSSLNQIVVYEIEAYKTLSDKVKVRITAVSSSGKNIPGLMAETIFAGEQSSLAAQLFTLPPLENPYPKGLEENPFSTLDQLVFHLSSQLADRYHQGLQADNQIVAKSEIRILLQPEIDNRIPAKLAGRIESALQQAIIARTNLIVAKKDNIAPAEATVILYLKTNNYPEKDRISISLRAAWRQGPLLDRKGQMITADLSGTYLNGFTAKGWMLAQNILPEAGFN